MCQALCKALRLLWEIDKQGPGSLSPAQKPPVAPYHLEFSQPGTSYQACGQDYKVKSILLYIVLRAVVVIYCYTGSDCQTWQLKTVNEYCLPVSMGQEARRSSAVKTRLQSSCQVGPRSLESLTKPGGCSFEKLHSHGCQQASAPHHVGFSVGFLECLHRLAADFSQRDTEERERGGSHNTFMTESWKSHTITPANFFNQE